VLPVKTKKRRLSRRLRYRLEAGLAKIIVPLVRLLPAARASAFGGWLGRSFGPWLGISRRARGNLRLVCPEKSEAEVDACLRGLWDNLGRTVFEMPHLARLADPSESYVEVGDMSPAYRVVEAGKPLILVSGHLANWELLSALSRRLGFDLVSIARDPNNPFVAELIEDLRGSTGRRIPKGAKGFKTAARVVRNRGVLGILCDQRLSQGIEAPFFGRPAMTTSAPARLALRYDCPIVPVRIERLGGPRFRISCAAALPMPPDGTTEEKTLALTRAINEVLEAWIREHPDQWLGLLHRRWQEAARDGLAASFKVEPPGQDRGLSGEGAEVQR
jgi:KDO2-lipid IV(A) lauroyltransferase